MAVPVAGTAILCWRPSDEILLNLTESLLEQLFLTLQLLPATQLLSPLVETLPQLLTALA